MAICLVQSAFYLLQILSLDLIALQSDQLGRFTLFGSIGAQRTLCVIILYARLLYAHSVASFTHVNAKFSCKSNCSTK